MSHSRDETKIINRSAKDRDAGRPMFSCITLDSDTPTNNMVVAPPNESNINKFSTNKDHL